MSTYKKPEWTNPFSFVKIPADIRDPIELLWEDGEGGLTDDALIKYVKQYFAQEYQKRSLTKSQIEWNQANQDFYTMITKQIEAAQTPDDRNQLADQLRAQLLQAQQSGNNNQQQITDMTDDQVLSFVQVQAYQSQQQSNVTAGCDIIAITVPTPANGFTAVSLYVSDHAVELESDNYNTRAAHLIVACGHDSSVQASQLRGDVFLGRAIDDETADVWVRQDFTVEDTDPTSEWCNIARQPGGGGGLSIGSGATSLNSLVQSQLGATGQSPQLLNAPMESSVVDTSAAATLFGQNGGPPVEESWGTWTQTKEEVELSIPVPVETKAKDCVIDFKRNALKIVVKTVSSETTTPTLLLQGPTFDPLEVDDCTFTLHSGQSEGPTGLRLVVTLGKTSNRTWSYVVQQQK